MGEVTYEETVLCVSDFEEDYLHRIGKPWDREAMNGITSFIKAAGGEPVPSAVPSAFEDEGDPETSDNDDIREGMEPFNQGIREGYREETGRKLPPIMRVKIHVEVEMLTEEENERAWNEHRRIIRAAREEPSE